MLPRSVGECDICPAMLTTTPKTAPDWPPTKPLRNARQTHTCDRVNVHLNFNAPEGKIFAGRSRLLQKGENRATHSFCLGNTFSQSRHVGRLLVSPLEGPRRFTPRHREGKRGPRLHSRGRRVCRYSVSSGLMLTEVI